MSCFDKTRRLLKKSEYDYVFAQASKLVTTEFIILHRSNTIGIARLGLAISKKKLAKACQRNRVKRLLRESFRLRQLPAVDIIFLARNDVTTVNNNVITANLGHAWEKLTNFYVN